MRCTEMDVVPGDPPVHAFGRYARPVTAPRMPVRIAQGEAIPFGSMNGGVQTNWPQCLD